MIQLVAFNLACVCAPLLFLRDFPLQIETETAYFTALQAADSTTFQREFEAEFLLLLEESEAQMYASRNTLAARKEFVAHYWNAANPNPLLPENDWLSDFLKRRAHARKNFPDSNPPLVDDRGKYYLKYGKPLRRYEDFGSLEVLPNETWSYENVTRNFVVHFKREGKVYREAQNLVEILSGNKRHDPDTEAKVLIAVARQRASVSPVFGRVFSKWLDLNTAQLHAQSFPTSRTALAIEWQQPHAILYAAAQHAKAEVAHARSVAPLTAHDALNAVNAITLREDLAQFRAPHGATRVEIAVRAPLKKNLVEKFSRETEAVLRLEYRARLSDGKFNALQEAQARTEFSVGEAAAHDFTNAVGKLVLTASPQECDLTLQVRDEREARLGFARKGLTLRDFSGAALMLSEVQLLLEINEEQRKILPTELKQERWVAPYPFDTIRKTLPVLCYFEIYNLHAASYQLTYEVTATKARVAEEQKAQPEKNAPTISVTMTRPAANEFTEELLALDLSQLQNGAYYLEVRVSDTNARAITARAQKLLVIED
ncbi:MAG: GWxTD domain-containing protein [candidate division KSB1 bacterium]